MFSAIVAVAEVREPTPSRLYARASKFATVRTDVPRRAAISVLLRPCATSSRTACSAGVSFASGFDQLTTTIPGASVATRRSFNTLLTLPPISRRDSRTNFAERRRRLPALHAALFAPIAPARMSASALVEMTTTTVCWRRELPLARTVLCAAVMHDNDGPHSSSTRFPAASATPIVAEHGNALLGVTSTNGGRAIQDPEEALAVWRALHDGRWTIIDRQEKDGRCTVVARTGDAALADVVKERIDDALSRRERQVVALVVLGHPNKHIASALTIATSTVATHLRHALTKLGARSRADLARRLMMD